MNIDIGFWDGLIRLIEVLKIDQIADLVILEIKKTGLLPYIGFYGIIRVSETLIKYTKKRMIGGPNG